MTNDFIIGLIVGSVGILAIKSIWLSYFSKLGKIHEELENSERHIEDVTTRTRLLSSQLQHLEQQVLREIQQKQKAREEAEAEAFNKQTGRLTPNTIPASKIGFPQEIRHPKPNKNRRQSNVNDQPGYPKPDLRDVKPPPRKP